MRSLFGRSRLLFAAAILLGSTSVFGSGFALYEQGAKATAMGGAFAATADDPSAIFFNVAGIAQQRRTEVLVGGTLINFQNEFTGDPNDIYSSGTTGKYRAHTFIPPNAYLIVPIGKQMTFGVGVMTPFGLRTNWENPWVGRFVSKDANIKVVSLQPSLAWQTADGKFALGGGIEYRRSRVILARNAVASTVNPFTGRFPDVASTYLSSDWKSKTGWNVGLLYRPGTWRVGVSYRAKMAVNFSGNVTITQILTGVPAVDQTVASQLPPSQPVRTTINMPAFTHVAIGTSAFENWDVEFDIIHTTWGDFKDLTVNFVTTPAAGFTRPQNWKNANSYRIGGNRKVTDDWDIRLGALYDKNPQPVEAVSPLLPDSDRIGASFGVGWHRGPWVLDLTEFALHFKKRSTNGQADPLTNINGTYKTDANLVSVNFGYKF